MVVTVADEGEEAEGMTVSIPEELNRYALMGILPILLADRSTGGNIVWATHAYGDLGDGYGAIEEMRPKLVSGSHAGVIRRRAQKDKEEQCLLTRHHAEVFTPVRICAMMIDYADSAWMASNDIQRLEDDWQCYVSSLRLEITCGEAPYLVNRYDAETGEEVADAEHRIGILDRKLRLISRNVHSRDEWLDWAIKAVEATYGYEYQGDNLLIARVNVLRDIEDYLSFAGYEGLSQDEYERFATIISWNLWQMDGLTNMTPARAGVAVSAQLVLFDDDDASGDGAPETTVREPAKIRDWKADCAVKFSKIQTKRRRQTMKFDYIIGNPPYQEESSGDNRGFARPIYHHFMDAAYQIADVVELIHPARFLFNAGSTPKEWNRKMLADPHLKVLWYEQDASSIFVNTDIKGGVAITYRDRRKDYGAIDIFTPYLELKSIMEKASPQSDADSLMSLIFIQNRFDLKTLYSDHPEYQTLLGSEGRDRRFRNNIFDKVGLFTAEKSEEDDIAVLGVVKNKRQWRYIPAKYVDHEHENLYKWKVLVVRVNGTGVLGEVLSTPIVASPGEGYTQTFISIGAFDDKSEAENVLKYVKTKFLRTMLGILKITQDNNRETWKCVPLQDFTSSSDIDWSQSVAGIDQQLYAKYGLDEHEIAFIESHVKEMI